jgi:selenocysteine lyase/cysteine desulfurase
MAAFTVAGMAVSEVAGRLEEEHGILCRPGLQCAPTAHRHLGTFPEGTVRISPGYGNTEEHVLRAVDAVRGVAAHA